MSRSPPSMKVAGLPVARINDTRRRWKLATASGSSDLSGASWKMPAPSRPRTATREATSDQRGQPTRDRPVGEREVMKAPRGAESHRTRSQCFFHFYRHRCDFGLGRLRFERPLPHHMGAHGRVAYVAGTVDSLGKGINRLEIFRICHPSPRHAGDDRIARHVLGSFDASQHQVHSRCGARCEREPAVPHHRSGDTV